jgi:hypothetical protein
MACQELIKKCKVNIKDLAKIIKMRRIEGTH